MDIGVIWLSAVQTKALACRSGQKRELDSYIGIVEAGGSIPPDSTNGIMHSGLGAPPERYSEAPRRISMRRQDDAAAQAAASKPTSTLNPTS
jgi:hypothetical protein